MNSFNQMAPIAQFAAMYAALLLAISVHESAHALLAYLLGDETSKRQNRISINPLDHIDIFGTVIFPIMAFFFHIPVIGWAKPVQVDPYNLRDARRDGIFISAAGPASNILAAFVLIAFLPIIEPLIAHIPPVIGFYKYAIYINAILAFFNLIPIPPLDGSGIMFGLLPQNLAEKYASINGFVGIMILYGLMLFGALDAAFSVAMKFLEAISTAAFIT
jgi:Zn-dependent protease